MFSKYFTPTYFANTYFAPGQAGVVSTVTGDVTFSAEPRETALTLEERRIEVTLLTRKVTCVKLPS